MSSVAYDDAGTLYDDPNVNYDGTAVSPAPVPAQTETSEHVVSYLFVDLATGLVLAELPLTGVTFSLALNDSGPWSGNLNVEDPRVAQLDWISATAPNKTAMYVQIDGVLVYGGIVQTSTYTMSAQQVQLGGSDFWAYFAQRVQARDYSTQWATTAASSIDIAYQMLSDAQAAANSMAIGLAKQGEPPSAYDITFSAPITDAMTIQSLVSQFQQMGYLVGFDFAMDVAWVGGFPNPTLTLSYPRRGRLAGSTGLAIDIADATEFKYAVDGSQQADRVLETQYATGAGAPTEAVWSPAMAVDGYPLLEAVEMHTLYSPVPEPAAALNAFAADDLVLYAYPVSTCHVTLPLFGNPGIGDFIVGDDVRLSIPPGTATFPANPRFPEGLDMYWRIVRADVTIADQGLSTMDLQLNLPPTSTPERPPV